MAMPTIQSCHSPRTERAGKQKTGALLVRSENPSFSQDEVKLLSTLKACASHKDLHKGSKIHYALSRGGFLQKNIYIGSALIDMFAKCGAMGKARQVFDELPSRNAISWTALIAGYAQHGQGEEALKCFEEMRRRHISPNAITFACILKACGSVGAIQQGKVIHTEIAKEGMLKRSAVLATALVDMYAKCGTLENAREVFDEFLERNVIVWTALMAGYAQHGKGGEALFCFKQMQQEGHSPNAVTFACILKACGSIGAVEQGKAIHAEIVKEGMLEFNIVLATSLVDMYAKCGILTLAREAFDELLDHSIITWTALLAGYAQHGKGEDALFCFQQMQQEGHSPNVLTFTSILKACGSMRAAQKGKQIHAQILIGGLLDNSNVLWTALVDMYAKCGALGKARQISDGHASRNIISWTALITRYCEQGHLEEALDCFQLMKTEGLFSDIVTFACVLKACGRIGAAVKGEKVHAEIVRGGLSGKMCALGGALVDMYAKCGALAKAKQAFAKLSYRSVVAWTALLAGHAQVGKHEKVFDLFVKMEEDGAEPNEVTFYVVLNICSSLNFVRQGQMYFDIMSKRYGIMPTSEHIVCMVSLFGRAGKLEKAMTILENIPSCARLPAWFAFLCACKKWDNVGLGRLAFQHLRQLEKSGRSCKDTGAMKSNIFQSTIFSFPPT